MNEHLEFDDGKSSKFWSIKVSGKTHTVNYGRQGTNGQSKTKEFDSAALAKSDAEKMVASKIKKGYASSAAKPSTKVKPKTCCEENGEEEAGQIRLG